MCSHPILPLGKGEGLYFGPRGTFQESVKTPPERVTKRGTPVEPICEPPSEYLFWKLPEKRLG